METNFFPDDIVIVNLTCQDFRMDGTKRHYVRNKELVMPNKSTLSGFFRVVSTRVNINSYFNTRHCPVIIECFAHAGRATSKKLSELQILLQFIL